MAVLALLITIHLGQWAKRKIAKNARNWCFSRYRTPRRVPPKGCEPLSFYQGFAAHFGISEAKTEAICEDAALRSVVQVWSTLDQATKDIVKTIVESRASTG